MEYTQKKRKSNRIGFRLVGILFIITSVFQLINVIFHNNGFKFLTVTFFVVGLCFGTQLICQSLRVQAYDLTYKFNDIDIIISNVRGEYTYSYQDVLDLEHILPAEGVEYDVIKLKLRGKKKEEQYTISLFNNRDFANRMYDFIDSRTIL